MERLHYLLERAFDGPDLNPVFLKVLAAHSGKGLATHRHHHPFPHAASSYWIQGVHWLSIRLPSHWLSGIPWQCSAISRRQKNCKLKTSVQ